MSGDLEMVRKGAKRSGKTAFLAEAQPMQRSWGRTVPGMMEKQ